MRNKLFITVVLFSLSSIAGFTQKQWTLKECIDYAIINNIEIQQTQLQIDHSKIQLNTAKNSRLPTLGANLGGNMGFGRGPSRDGNLVDNTQTSTSFGVSLNMPVYQGSRIKNEILVSSFNLKSRMQNYAAAKEDLSLNVVSLYMQILFNKELLTVANSQYELSSGLVNKTKVLYENGRVPEGQYYESISSMTKDKLSIVEANNRLELSLLDLIHALNITNSEKFDVVSPVIDSIPASIISGLGSVSDIYATSVLTRPTILGQEYNLKSSEQNIKVVRSAFYPSISLGLGYNNSYYYSFGSEIDNRSFSSQMEMNGNETIGLNVSIPIFNRLATRNQVRMAQIDIKNQTLYLDNAKLALRKEIEMAHKNAEASIAGYIASLDALKTARVAFAYENKKSEAGRSTIFDFNDSKASLFRVESELVRAKYQFLFNKKILDFYNNIPLAK